MPADTVQLAGHPVHRMGFGAMQLPGPGVLGPPADRDQALAILRRAVDAGVDHIDTAQFYGPGTANELIRAALSPFPGRLALVSKVGAEHAGGDGIVPAQRPRQLRESVEANLAALGTDHLAVVNLRRLDASPGLQAQGDQLVDLDSQLAELIALRDEGKIGGIGLSSVSAGQLRQSLPAGIACVQNAYSVLDRAGEPVLRLCREQDIAWVPFFPLGSAFPGRPKVAEHAAVIAAAASYAATPAQVGLAWLLARYSRTLLIPGTASLAHLDDNIAAGSLRLRPETVAALDQLAAVAGEGTA